MYVEGSTSTLDVVVMYTQAQFSFCRALAAFAERAADAIGRTDGELLPLVQLLVGVLGGELRVAEMTLPSANLPRTFREPSTNLLRTFREPSANLQESCASPS